MIGSGDGQFSYQDGVAVDSSSENVYVADYGNDRIQKFNSSGIFITKWGSEGTDDGEFSSPTSVAVDSSQNVYVVDSGNMRIEVFARSRQMSAAPAIGNATSSNMTAATPSNQTNISSSDVSTLVSRGTTLFNLGDYNGALQYYDRALAIDPNYEVALYNKGNALARLGRYAEAIQSLDKSLAIDPNYKEALNNEGAALQNLGNSTAAIQYVDKALAIDPNFQPAINNKNYALVHQGNPGNQ